MGNKGASFSKIIWLSVAALIAFAGGAVLVIFAVKEHLVGSIGFIAGIVVLAAGMALFLWSFILVYMYLYRAWLYIQDGLARSKPGQAVGFLFIPLFNYYWFFPAFLGWAQDYNKYIKRYNLNLPLMPEDLFMAFAILNCVMAVPYLNFLAILPYVVIFTIVLVKICNTVNSLVKIHDQNVTAPESFNPPLPRIELEDKSYVIAWIMSGVFVLTIILIGVVILIALPYLKDIPWGTFGKA